MYLNLPIVLNLPISKTEKQLIGLSEFAQARGQNLNSLNKLIDSTGMVQYVDNIQAVVY